MTAPESRQDAVLVVNAGSSTLKFALYPRESRPPGGDPSAPGSFPGAQAAGQIDGLQPGGELRLCPADGPARVLPAPSDAGDAERFDLALAAMRDHLHHAAPQVRPLAVAHRIVHGGEICREPVRLDNELLSRLGKLEPLAPLHQPHNLAGVRALMRAYPGLPQIGCFDTAFHAGMPALERRYALPRELHDQGLKRYGFHGLSYDYLMQVLRARSQHASGRVLMAHLGSGASLCAARDGGSIASSMGFSALDGLMMGSRSGAIDPGILLHLWREGWSLGQVEKLLYKQSGLLGVSGGRSADMRRLHGLVDATADGASEAGEAIALFNHRLRREAGALIATLGGLDLLAFTGGIGEHDASVRAALSEGLVYLGVQLDAEANLAADGSAALPIHASGSRVQVWVVPTDEGRVAAQAAWRLLGS
jgi:acetate kinase